MLSVDALLALNEVYSALLALIEVANELLYEDALAKAPAALELFVLKLVATDELNVVYPVVSEIVICTELETILSPVALNIAISFPNVPAIHLSFVVSHNIEPVKVLAPAPSLT